MTRIASLGEIRCDPRAFPREGLDPGRVDEFAALYRDELPTSNDPFPPIGCIEDRDGALWCYDGWHRLAARKRVVAERPDLLGEIPVQFVRAGNRDPADLAFELAVESSAHGPRPLTLHERVRAAKRLSEIRPDLSAREIARRAGVSHQTVLRSRGTVAPSVSPRLLYGPDPPPRTRDRQTGTSKTEHATLRWEAAADDLVHELIASTRGLLGGDSYKSAGRELARALVDRCGADNSIKLLGAALGEAEKSA